jgi:phospholipid/cholesterol/gamma-HCH transport system substrate-binding protein
MKLKKTSKIGILVVFCLTLLVWGINFLKGRDIFRTERVYYARYENVGGLTATTLVTLNGLKIGYVREIYFAEDLSGDLIVKIALHNNFPLPVGTTAQISSSDLLGSKVVKINLGKSDKLLLPNDTLNTQMEADIMQQVNEQIAPIKAKAERLIENLDSIVTAASKVLSSDAQNNISESIRQIQMTMTNLEKISTNLSDVISGQKNNLASTISNLSEITGNLKNNSGKLGHIMDNFSSLSDSLKKLELNRTIENVNSSVASLETILAKIDTANGSLGLLVNDPRLYQNINYTSENLNRLLIDFRTNPKRYLHFSAVDLGRQININTPSNPQLSDNITFRVQIFSSSSPVSLTSPIFKGIDEVFEIKSGNKFYYYTAPESSYEKVRMVLNKAQSAFPEAFLKSYKNGKEISLKNALKTINK